MNRPRVLFWVMIAMFLATAAAIENGYAADWTKKSIAKNGYDPSIVLDQNGNGHLFWVRLGYNLNELMHSWFDGKRWCSENLDTFHTGSWSSVVVDQEGKIHLVYGYNLYTSNPELKYASFDGVSWKSEVLEDGGFTPTITIAPDGFPRIVHVTNNIGTLRYLSFDGISWTREDIGSGVRGNIGTSMAFFPDGSPVVAWTADSNPTNVHVAWREENMWNSLTVFEGKGARIVVDKSDTIHLVYNKGDGYAHAQYDGLSWEEKSLTTSTQILGKDVSPGLQAAPGLSGIPDLAVDAEGTLHVILDIWLASERKGTASLIYGFFDGTGWHSEKLAKSGPEPGGFTYRIVLNPQGIPHVGLSRIASSTPVVEYYHYKGKKLSVSVRGDGTVTSKPEGITCGGDCSESFFPGNSVTVTAVPSPGMNFLGWSGACQGTNSTCTLIMDQTKRVTAEFGK